MRGVRRWEWHKPSIVQTPGPSYHRDAMPDEPYEPPKIRLGFAPPRREVEQPLTWEGDQA